MGILHGITATTTSPCRVKVSTTDTTCAYLGNKLKAGTNITIGTTSDATYGSVLEISATPAAYTETNKVKVAVGDTAGYLGTKVLGTAPIVATVNANDVTIKFTGKLTVLTDVNATVTSPVVNDLFVFNGTKWTNDLFEVHTATWAYDYSGTSTLSTDKVVRGYVDDLDFVSKTTGVGLMYREEYKSAYDLMIVQYEYSAGISITALTTTNLVNPISQNTALYSLHATTSTSVETNGYARKQIGSLLLKKGFDGGPNELTTAYATAQAIFNISEDFDNTTHSLDAKLEIIGFAGTTSAGGTSMFRLDVLQLPYGAKYSAVVTLIDGRSAEGTVYFKHATDDTIVQKAVVELPHLTIDAKDQIYVSVTPWYSGRKTDCWDGTEQTATTSELNVMGMRLIYQTGNPRMRVADY